MGPAKLKMKYSIIFSERYISQRVALELGLWHDERKIEDVVGGSNILVIIIEQKTNCGM